MKKSNFTDVVKTYKKSVGKKRKKKNEKNQVAFDLK